MAEPTTPGPAASPDLARAVGPLELFFDLVFVFAVSQLSDHLLTQLTWRGAGETAVLLVAVFSVWAYTSFEATSRDVERKDTQRTLLAVMFTGLFMNAAVNSAFSSSPWPFAVPYLISQIGPAAAAAVTVGPAELRRHYRRALVWLAAAAPLWIAGAALEPGPRLACWAAAAAIDLAGTWLAHPLPGRTLRSRQVPFDGEHMIERLRLFLIIALGEAVLRTGTAIADAPARPLTIAAGAAGLAVVVTFWAMYFSGSDSLVARHLGRTPDPVRAARLALNGTYPTLAALIALAVGNELVIARPGSDGSPALSLLLFGGALLYVASQAWYLQLTTGTASRPRWAACAALVAGGCAATALPRLAGLGLLLIVLGALTWHLIRNQPPPDHPGHPTPERQPRRRPARRRSP